MIVQVDLYKRDIKMAIDEQLQTAIEEVKENPLAMEIVNRVILPMLTSWIQPWEIKYSEDYTADEITEAHRVLTNAGLGEMRYQPGLPEKEKRAQIAEAFGIEEQYQGHLKEQTNISTSIARILARIPGFIENTKIPNIEEIPEKPMPECHEMRPPYTSMVRPLTDIIQLKIYIPKDEPNNII